MHFREVLPSTTTELRNQYNFCLYSKGLALNTVKFIELQSTWLRSRFWFMPNSMPK